VRLSSCAEATANLRSVEREGFCIPGTRRVLQLQQPQAGVWLAHRLAQRGQPVAVQRTSCQRKRLNVHVSGQRSRQRGCAGLAARVGGAGRAPEAVGVQFRVVQRDVLTHRCVAFTQVVQQALRLGSRVPLDNDARSARHRSSRASRRARHDCGSVERRSWSEGPGDVRSRIEGRTPSVSQHRRAASGARHGARQQLLAARAAEERMTASCEDGVARPLRAHNARALMRFFIRLGAALAHLRLLIGIRRPCGRVLPSGRLAASAACALLPRALGLRAGLRLIAARASTPTRRHDTRRCHSSAPGGEREAMRRRTMRNCTEQRQLSAPVCNACSWPAARARARWKTVMTPRALTRSSVRASQRPYTRTQSRLSLLVARSQRRFARFAVRHAT
jgi:hypothetical protein